MTRKQNTGLTGNFLLCRQYLIAKRHSYLAWRLRELCFVPDKMSQLVPNWQWTSTRSKCTLWPVDWWKFMEIYGKRWGICGGITLNINFFFKKACTCNLVGFKSGSLLSSIKTTACESSAGSYTSGYLGSLWHSHQSLHTTDQRRTCKLRKTRRGKKKGKWHR